MNFEKRYAFLYCCIISNSQPADCTFAVCMQASKWKRKAKLAVKNGGVGTSSKAAMHMSSSSHGTEEDSDASYRMMYPQSRRASNAMADLSSLMEQSLVSIRKESLVPPTPRLRR